MLKQFSRKALVSQITLCDRAVYACANEDFLSSAPSVVVGTERLSFRRLPGAPALDVLARDIPLRVPQDAPRKANSPALQVGDLGEWEVPGWRTLRVVIGRAIEAQRVPLDGSLTITPEDGSIDLLASLACHRARARLVAVLSDRQGNRIDERAVHFDAQASGGATVETYQSVRLALPDRDTAQILTLEVDHIGSAYTGTDEPSVLFIARPRIAARGHGEVSTPISLTLDHTAVCDTWFRADLVDAVQARSGISLSLKKTTLPILPPDGTRLEMRRSWGHLLEFQAKKPCNCVAWINDRPEFQVSMQEGYNGLRIPQNQLLGTHAKVELRDPAGMITYWGDWMLLPRQTMPVDVLHKQNTGPLRSDLFPQTPLRFEAFRAHVIAGTSPQAMVQLAHALDALEAGYDRLDLRPLVFPQIEAPEVSIVIVAHDRIEATYAGLCGLLLARTKASFEVIVVESDPTDETAGIGSLVEGITVLRTEMPQGRSGAGNLGVEKARGKYVVLLDSETEPTIGWLDEMIDAFDRFPDVGLTGVKLLYRDGKLRDAGGIVWSTGDPSTYGDGQNPWEPRFSYARQVDCLSRAALMTTREIWDKVGGLSSDLEPTGLADTDLAFKIREAGYGAWFVPSALVYHGGASALDSGASPKREAGLARFKRRWVQAFAGHAKPGTAPDLEKDRGIAGRILFVDHETPTPDQDAASFAAIQEIRLVQSFGYKVTFLPENVAYFGRYTSELQKMGVEVITAPYHTSVEGFLKQRGAEFDAFYITRYYVVKNAVPVIRTVNPEAKIIMNNADLHYLRLLRKAVSENDEAQKETARDVRAEEFAAMQSVDLVLSYNEMEHAVIEAQSEGGIKVMPCPWVLDLPQTVAGRGDRAGLSFLGAFQHHPNVEGIEWFAQSVMRRLESTRPDIVLSIYGSKMSDRIADLASGGIDPVGHVKEIADAYDRHLVFVAPLLSGAGIKGKVLSALAHGIPCVLSPVAAEGIGLVDGRDCLIAKTPEEWETAIIRAHDDTALWQQLSDNGRDLARSRFSFDRGRQLMQAALEEVGLFRHLSF